MSSASVTPTDSHVLNAIPSPQRISTVCFYQKNDDGEFKTELELENGNISMQKTVGTVDEKPLGFTCKQKLSLVSLCLIDFMSSCNMSILAPFFPREASKIGMSETLCGFFFSFSAIIMFVSAPFFGKFLPKVGEKFMLTTGLSLSGAAYIVFGTLDYTDDFLTFTLLCFLIQGLIALGTSAYFTASFVFVVNVFPQHSATVRGTLETFVGLGMSAGPAIGALLYSFGGFSLPFYVFGFTGLLLIPITMYLLPPSKNVPQEEKRGSLRSLLKVPGVLITSFVTVLISITWAFLDPTLEPHLRQYDLSPESIGLLFLLLAASYGISSPICGVIADRINNHWSMMTIGLFVNCLSLLLLGPSPITPFIPSSIWTVIIGLTTVGMSVASATIPSYDGIVLHATKAGFEDNLTTQSLVAGLWSSAYSLGEVIGPSAGGVLLQYCGFPMGATVLAAFNLLLVIICVLFFGYVSKRIETVSVSNVTTVSNSERTLRTSIATTEYESGCDMKICDN